MRTALIALAATALFLAFAAPPAVAQTATEAPAAERAAEALRTDNVYVDPEADPGLSPAEVSRLRAQIAEGESGPVYVAVLPEEAVREAGGTIGALPREIGGRLRREGTYVVVAGEEIAAASTLLERGEASTLAREAAEANGGAAPAAVLSDFVRRVGEARAGGGGGGEPRPDGDGGLGGAGLLGILFAGAAGFLGLRALRRRREERARLAEVKEVARDDLVALGDDIRALDIDVEMPDVDPAARADYGQAVGSYERANELFGRARRPEDLEPVSAALEEGRFAMASAKARLEGNAPPERRPPCFFDPRHGPSARDVEWAPDGGAARPVPACEDDARRMEAGEDPAAREVMVGGRSMPYWNAPAYYGPWAGGFFGGLGGGLLPGLLMGSMLGWGLGWGGGMMFPGDAWGDAGGDTGDFGGGDFGGGFGGGDFGGGDFGG